jgi:hypothetical protein
MENIIFLTSKREVAILIFNHILIRFNDFEPRKRVSFSTLLFTYININIFIFTRIEFFLFKECNCRLSIN